MNRKNFFKTLFGGIVASTAIAKVVAKPKLSVLEEMSKAQLAYNIQLFKLEQNLDKIRQHPATPDECFKGEKLGLGGVSFKLHRKYVIPYYRSAILTDSSQISWVHNDLFDGKYIPRSRDRVYINNIKNELVCCVVMEDCKDDIVTLKLFSNKPSDYLIAKK